MTAFDKAISLYFKRETINEGEDRGTNDPRDPGGLTRFGIAQNYHPEIDVKNITRDGAIVFYKREYWDPLNLDAVAEHSERIAIKLFDIAGSQGQSRAGAWLQLALNSMGHRLAVDGKIGRNTLEALRISVNEGYTNQILALIRHHSLRQRINRVQQRPDQVWALEGWVFRSLDLDGRFS